MLAQATTMDAVVRWARLPADTALEEEIALAEQTATEAGLAALSQRAAELEVPDRLAAQVEEAYQQRQAAQGRGRGLWSERDAVQPGTPGCRARSGAEVGPVGRKAQCGPIELVISASDHPYWCSAQVHRIDLDT